MGKEWYKPTTGWSGPKSEPREKKRLDIGKRSLRNMRLTSISSDEDVSKLNEFLWDIQNAVTTFQVVGSNIGLDTVSSNQIAPRSVAGSCLAAPIDFEGDLTVSGAVSATSGFYTQGDISAAGDAIVAGLTAQMISAVEDISADNISANTGIWVGNATTTGNITISGAAGGLSTEGNIAAAGVLSVGGDTRINGNLGIGAAPIYQLDAQEWGNCLGRLRSTVGGYPALVLENSGTAWWIYSRADDDARDLRIYSNTGDLVKIASTGEYLSAIGDVIAASATLADGVVTPYLSAHETIQTSGISHSTSGWFANGATGWFDDGANFRVYVSGGIVTEIGATVAGGFG